MHLQNAEHPPVGDIFVMEVKNRGWEGEGSEEKENNRSMCNIFQTQKGPRFCNVVLGGAKFESIFWNHLEANSFVWNQFGRFHSSLDCLPIDNDAPTHIE